MISKDSLNIALNSLQKEKQDLLEMYAGYELQISYELSILNKAILEFEEYFNNTKNE